ncbi:hypothetical protein, partial [Hydrocoleum sp. CS-953]|uniref:phthiocerol/phthiodiolone dimycocerosyl transferase family protein n=1 Tax=Hydrocoleum sp. CS-953 TaxID=1671698 RepID=UPI00352BA318
MLSQEKTKTLIEKCKEEKTTVHGAISAAMLFASAKLFSTDNSVNLSYGLPVSLRKYCQPEITKENLGCLISFLSFNQLVNSNAIFWDLARECKSEIHNALMNGTHINLLKKAKLQPDISLDIQREKMIKSILNRE